jgi:hypothetical protein
MKSYENKALSIDHRERMQRPLPSTGALIDCYFYVTKNVTIMKPERELTLSEIKMEMQVETQDKSI